MNYELLQTVVLARDLPEQGLQRGDLGAVVGLYEPDALDVEFVTASGGKAALVTLRTDEVRAVLANDLVAVRPYRPSA